MIATPQLLKAGSYLLVFFFGMAVANSWATRQALTVQADIHAKEQAAVSQALIVKAKDDQKRVNEAMEQQATAYDAALVTYETEMEQAKASADRARRELAAEFQKNKQLAENVDDLKMVNKMLAEEFPVPEPVSGCNMPVGVRRAIDGYIASINNRPASGGAEAPAAGVPFSPNPTDQILTCEQLAHGVTEILDHDAMLTAWLLSWQQWANEALK